MLINQGGEKMDKSLSLTLTDILTHRFSQTLSLTLTDTHTSTEQVNT